ncbi:MAG: hypothetical protein IIA66_03950, partial [Planctomycetes bacterium]|nr:hypothetical protein [Planctomycetota bacterium]
RSKRAQYTGGKFEDKHCQLSPWFSETHTDPVVLPNAGGQEAALGKIGLSRQPPRTN